jgi:hypothetical protein
MILLSSFPKLSSIKKSLFYDCLSLKIKVLQSFETLVATFLSNPVILYFKYKIAGNVQTNLQIVCDYLLKSNNYT